MAEEEFERWIEAAARALHKEGAPVEAVERARTVLHIVLPPATGRRTIAVDEFAAVLSFAGHYLEHRTLPSLQTMRAAYRLAPPEHRAVNETIAQAILDESEQIPRIFATMLPPALPRPSQDSPVPTTLPETPAAKERISHVPSFNLDDDDDGSDPG